MSDHWAERLSEYLDDGLDPEERRAMEAHLVLCVRCTATLDELREVKSRARALETPELTRDLWSGIAERIAAEGAPVAVEPPRRPAIPFPTARRLSFTLPQFVAAAAALMVVSGAAVWYARGTIAAREAAREPLREPVAAAPQQEATPAETAGQYQYDAAIADLEQVLAQRSDELDSTTVRVLRQNLRTIKQATAEARRALAADPSNPYLRDYLEDEMVRKLQLLQRAAVTAAASR